MSDPSWALVCTAELIIAVINHPVAVAKKKVNATALPDSPPRWSLMLRFSLVKNQMLAPIGKITLTILVIKRDLNIINPSSLCRLAANWMTPTDATVMNMK